MLRNPGQTTNTAAVRSVIFIKKSVYVCSDTDTCDSCRKTRAQVLGTLCEESMRDFPQAATHGTNHGPEITTSKNTPRSLTSAADLNSTTIPRNIFQPVTRKRKTPPDPDTGQATPRRECCCLLVYCAASDRTSSIFDETRLVITPLPLLRTITAGSTSNAQKQNPTHMLPTAALPYPRTTYESEDAGARSSSHITEGIPSMNHASCLGRVVLR